MSKSLDTGRGGGPPPVIAPRRRIVIVLTGDVLHWPSTRLVGPRRLLLEEDYAVDWTADGYPRQRIIVPAGFECDGASVPALVAWYLERDRIWPAAAVHDWHYAHPGRLPAGSHLYLGTCGAWHETDHAWTRAEADRLFARLLAGCEIRSDQRRMAYRGVRLGGWVPWRRAARGRGEG